MVKPTTFSPRACNTPATTELSTPPDIATATLDIRRSQSAQMRHGLANSVRKAVHLGFVVAAAQRNTNARSSLFLAQANRGENMRRLARAARTRRPARNRIPAQIESD